MRKTPLSFEQSNAGAHFLEKLHLFQKRSFGIESSMAKYVIFGILKSRSMLYFGVYKPFFFCSFLQVLFVKIGLLPLFEVAIFNFLCGISSQKNCSRLLLEMAFRLYVNFNLTVSIEEFFEEKAKSLPQFRQENSSINLTLRQWLCHSFFY